MSLLNVPHHQQQQRADCLAACSAMVLDYLAIPVRYARLLHLLRIDAAGTSFFNLQKLTALHMHVHVAEGNMDFLSSILDEHLPLLASVETAELPYWQISVRHAVVVIGLDNNYVYLNDPAFVKAPQVVSRQAFELAWLTRDYLCAVIRLTHVG